MADATSVQNSSIVLFWESLGWTRDVGEGHSGDVSLRTQQATTARQVERDLFWAQRPRSLNRSLQRDPGGRKWMSKK
jgi:hypothetical protein